jgi:hypothetical protein
MAIDTLCRRCRQPIRAGELYTLEEADGYAHAICNRPDRPGTCPRCVERTAYEKTLAAGRFMWCTSCGWERRLRR